MEIVYLGHSAFKLSGKEVSVVCDPFSSDMVGIKMPKVEADIVTVSHSHSDHDNLESIKSEYICFDSPGEYEIKNTEIIGVKSFHDSEGGKERGQNTIFLFEIDGIHICHLGDLGEDLSSEQIEKINSVDILLIPVGGKYTIDSKSAVKIISELEPKIVIPMHYRAGKMTELDPLENFVAESGLDAKKIEKLKVTKKDLPEKLELVILQSY